MESIKTLKIESLKPFAKNVNVIARVLNKGETKEVTSKKTGDRRRLAEALIGDETGTIILTLWDDNIEKVESGGTYLFQNTFVTIFNGHMRLNLGKYGGVSKSDVEIEESSINRDNNLSDKEIRVQRRYKQGSRGGSYRPHRR